MMAMITTLAHWIDTEPISKLPLGQGVEPAPSRSARST